MFYLRISLAAAKIGYFEALSHCYSFAPLLNVLLWTGFGSAMHFVQLQWAHAPINTDPCFSPLVQLRDACCKGVRDWLALSGGERGKAPLKRWSLHSPFSHCFNSFVDSRWKLIRLKCICIVLLSDALFFEYICFAFSILLRRSIQQKSSACLQIIG